MGNEVYANGMEVSCKAGEGKSICAFPDVCFTPPLTPATPPGVPIPYPNTGMASDTTDGTKTVQVTGKEVMLKDKSCFKQSTGNEAGSAPKKGVVTSKNKGKVYFNAWSMDVKFEGENVVRNLDLTTHNHASQVGNSPPWAYLDAAATKPIKDCEEETKDKKEKCEDKGLKTREAQCADSDCSKAKKCLLVSYNQGSRDSEKATVGCCEGEQPHHLIESHGFCEQGERGDALTQFNGYKVNEAPCVCAAGDRWTKEHGAFHALVGQKENAAVAAAAAAGGDKDFAWTYGDAKKAGVDAHQKIFPDSECSTKCLEAQLDRAHKPPVVDDNTTLRTGTQGLQPWQTEAPEDVICIMEAQLGEAAAGL